MSIFLYTGASSDSDIKMTSVSQSCPLVTTWQE